MVWTPVDLRTMTTSSSPGSHSTLGFIHAAKYRRKLIIRRLPNTSSEGSPVSYEETDQECITWSTKEKSLNGSGGLSLSRFSLIISSMRYGRLSGQSLYQGAELGSDNRIYFVPGHAARVMVCDHKRLDKVEQIGPSFVEKQLQVAPCSRVKR
jgi:hypothetical protein